MRSSRPLAALACVGAALGLACCTAPAPEPTPAPPSARASPRPAPTPVATPAATFADWMDAPQTPGDWFYRRTPGNTAALFGTGGSDARFAVTCRVGQRRITLARGGTATGAAPMTIRTETATRTLSAMPDPGELPSLVATLAATDPLLDAMAFSKGRFAVEVPGQPSLYLPSWPEVTRVIEDCR